LLNGFVSCEDSNADGWISAPEVFNYAKPSTEQIVSSWDNESHPVSYYDMFGGDIPLVQRDPTKALDLPPLVSLSSPQNLVVYSDSVPLTLFVNKPVQSVSYSLDGSANVTIEGSMVLVDLAEGVHSIVVYAIDASGNVGKSRMVHFKKGIPLVARFTWSPIVQKLNQSMIFDASASTFDGGIMEEYRWDFGDGQNANGRIVTHTYTALGTYTVTLTIAESQLWNFEEGEAWVDLEDTGHRQVQVILGGALDFENETFNLKSKDEWIFVYVELPEGYDVHDVNVSTVVFNDTVLAEPGPATMDDHDDDGAPDLMLKFNRTAVSELILSEGLVSGNVTLTATGKLYDGTLFEGSGVIKVRMPGDINCDGKVDVKDVALVSFAFGSYPGHPRWKLIADENEDGKIDVRDVSLIARNFGRTYT
jgi:PKD repeat protein